MGRRKGRKGRKRQPRRERESLGAKALRQSEARRRRRRTDDDGLAGAFAAAPPDEDRWAGGWQDAGPRSLVALARQDMNADLHPGRERGAPAALTCEDCHEFVPGETGRGRCLHPGSGVLAPWPDTEACQFHEARRRR